MFPTIKNFQPLPDGLFAGGVTHKDPIGNQKDSSDFQDKLGTSKQDANIHEQIRKGINKTIIEEGIKKIQEKANELKR